LICKNKRTSNAQISVREHMINKEGTGKRMTRKNQLIVDQTGIEVDDLVFWEVSMSIRSKRRWTRVYYDVIHEYSLEDIAKCENVSVEAVKSWAKEARKKLRNETHLKANILKTLEGA